MRYQLTRTVFRGGALGHVPPTFGAEGALLSRQLPRMEKLFSGYCALKVKGKSSWKVHLKRINSQKRSIRIALDTGGVFSIVHSLGLVPP